MNTKITCTPKDAGLITLSSTDSTLRKLILLVGNLEIELRQNYYESLIMTIIGQQLSAKAARTIKNRVIDLLHYEITPERVLSTPVDQFRGAGVSSAKTSYILTFQKKYNKTRSTSRTSFNLKIVK